MLSWLAIDRSLYGFGYKQESNGSGLHPWVRLALGTQPRH
jgi:hypothetical protein